MSGDQLVGFAFVAGMVAYVFVGASMERIRADRAHRAERVARMVAAAERDGRVAR